MGEAHGGSPDRGARAEQAEETQLEFLQASTVPAFWRVFHGHAVLGLSVPAIARAEGAPVPTCYNRLRLARRDLRAAIVRLRAIKGRSPRAIFSGAKQAGQNR